MRAARLRQAAVPIVPLLIRNQLVLGAFWRTGYSLTNEQTGFGWSYFTQHALQYIQQINSGGLGLMLALDRQWLGRAGVPDGFVKGVIGLSGPYDFYPYTSDSARHAFVAPRVPGTPEDLARHQAADSAKWGKVVKEQGIRFE